MATQLQEGLASERGIRAFVADSNYNGTSELIVFAHTEGMYIEWKMVIVLI